MVFTREVNNRTAADPRVRELEAALGPPPTASSRPSCGSSWPRVRAAVRSEKLGEVAAEFEGIHNIERAREVGSVHTIIPAAELRPHLIDAVERGMARADTT